MTMSVQTKKAYDVARKYDKKLLATDPRFSCSVHIVDEDGTVLMFEYAFALKWEDEDMHEWLLVFTEHHEFNVYPTNGLLHYLVRGPAMSIEKLEES